MTTLLGINNYYYSRGGAETVFLEHNRMFAEQGWRVVPFAMQHPKNFATPWSRYFVEEIEFGTQYSLFDKLRRAPRVIYSLEARRKLAQLLDSIDADVCHAHNLYHHISPSILGLLKRRGVPTVLTLHDLKIACPAYNMLAHDGVCERCKNGHLHNVLVHRCIKRSIALSTIVMLESILHRLLGSYGNCVSRFVVPSRFYIDKLAEWRMPTSLFRHVPNFVAVDRFEPMYTPGRAFIYFGRVSAEKGIETLVRSALISKCPVWIVGTGAQEAELKRLVAESGADVSFLGYLTGNALHDAIRSSRAVVLPSEWYENAPMSILEAYALGKPVIGARIGGIPELVRDGETGMTFTSGDIQSLAAAMQAMSDLRDGEVAEMGRCGRSWVEAEFTSTEYLRRVLAVYRELDVPGSEALISALPGGAAG